MNHLLTETNLAQYDTAALAQLLAVLPASWRARAERYKPFDARLRSALGYTLLARLLREHFGIADLPPIATDEHGKPYLLDCPLHFSISHCKAAVACIVDERPVGLDVQDILTDVSPALAARIAAPLDKNGCISEATAQLLKFADRAAPKLASVRRAADTSCLSTHRAANEQSPDARRSEKRKPEDLSPRDLTILWAQKEASAKLDGRGLKIGLEHLPLTTHVLSINIDGSSCLYCIAINNDSAG